MYEGTIKWEYICGRDLKCQVHGAAAAGDGEKKEKAEEQPPQQERSK